MQHSACRTLSLSIVLLGLIASSAQIEAAEAPKIKEFKDIKWTKEGAFAAFGIATTLYLYAALQMKKTQPKRVYPEDDSLSELLTFVHDELLVGQKCLPERPSGFHIDEENPERFVYEYSKVDARGFAGISEVYLQKVIIPTIILAVGFSALKGKISANFFEIINWIANPKSLFALPDPAPVSNGNTTTTK